jgi:hypothetical protein
MPIVIPAPSPFDTPDSELIIVKPEPDTQVIDLDELDDAPDVRRDLIWEQCVQLRRYRVGGVRSFDRIMRDVPLALPGIAAQEQRNKEEDLCFYEHGQDADKSLAVMWGRWIARWRSVRFLKFDNILIWSMHGSPAFRQNPMKNIELFIKGHGGFIEESGGLNALIKFLLVSGVIMLHLSMLNIMVPEDL